MAPDESANSSVSEHSEIHENKPEDPKVPSSTKSSPDVSYIQISCMRKPDNDDNDFTWQSQKTLGRNKASREERDDQLAKLSGAVKTILECIGEDPSRQGLLHTPMRYAESILYFTRGYEESLDSFIPTSEAEYKPVSHREMFTESEIDFSSICEHHLIPFSGKIHVGYIPKLQDIDRAKVIKIVETLSQRLQLQRRLTNQIAFAISDILQAQGVAVFVESSHICMAIRGKQQPGEMTMTSCLLGSCKAYDEARIFFDRIGRRELFLHLFYSGPGNKPN
ncbi:GTP cyclohydrolase I [Microthyrium microscopicum]|uniref:GTP cyclohydrolase 1 n=1 Tax=Microthyrium microscopicum TaxID=703497 RepID=A0A6A6UB09_9PEZI|nr:GTP cyclohydrolase I [Microthyrium microscopicum]